MSAGADAVPLLLDWFAERGDDLPWRRTRDRYRVLVAEAMLQATPVARVVPYYERWIERWPTAESLGAAPLGDVLAAWHGLGYPRRARRLRDACRAISRDGWPKSGDLTDLPGVGRYTAAALRCFADEEDVLPVDTNVSRIMARRFPDGWPGAPGAGWAAGQALMDLGRRICTARRPDCSACPLRTGCAAADAGPVRDWSTSRRQGRYEGSMRQRRGRLLGRLSSGVAVAVADDPEAAESLIADGLAAQSGHRLTPAP